MKNQLEIRQRKKDHHVYIKQRLFISSLLLLVYIIGIIILPYLINTLFNDNGYSSYFGIIFILYIVLIIILIIWAYIFLMNLLTWVYLRDTVYWQFPVEDRHISLRIIRYLNENKIIYNKPKDLIFNKLFYKKILPIYDMYIIKDIELKIVIMQSSKSNKEILTNVFIGSEVMLNKPSVSKIILDIMYCFRKNETSQSELFSEE